MPHRGGGGTGLIARTYAAACRARGVARIAVVGDARERLWAPQTRRELLQGAERACAAVIA